MEISIKEILKAILNKWYIMLAAVSVLTAIGTGIGIKSYQTPTYTASSSYLFAAGASSNVNLYIGNFKAYLETTNLTYQIENEIYDEFGSDVDYEVKIATASSLLSVTVTSKSEAVALAVMQAYENKILDEDNIIRGNDLTVEKLFPINARVETPSISSLLIKIALFMIIGGFLGGAIILIPLYNLKSKEEKERQQATV